MDFYTTRSRGYARSCQLASSALRGVLAAVVFACTFAATCAQAAPAEPVKNIVLVHGAFADGSSWAKVIPILQAKGYNVTAVQNPLTSFADDVAATNRALALQTGPVILVGHSWGGVVITEAGVDPKVVGLVYVAAFGPDAGEVVGDIGKAYPPPPALAAPIVDKQGFMTLPTDAVVKHFASDLPPAEARVVAATQGPINASAFGTKVSTRRVEDEAVVVHRLQARRRDRARRRALLREAHEGDDHGTEHEPRGDALEAEGCGCCHHGRGGEGPALTIDRAVRLRSWP